MSKTLSNGTLGLRFMQNAQRARDNSELKPDKATLVDDAEWHIPQNARDAWTSAGTAAANSKWNAVSEPSYLPFLFHNEDRVSPSFNGRRSFVKGKEVIPVVCFTFLLPRSMRSCD
ncbi:hypothetical protein BDM02DRAFT_3100359 [Thelephora ganbajun]|uniref:Uncharacterized protein n=1 Tax=Thelephora ganbajun TaxID=370292 RepID=A0ACB6Z953_THEGA|nr:hypothetical protein BDM02DRAFT_3100359 [Thelephora ganbajun]